jgi:hypothetical protein
MKERRQKFDLEDNDQTDMYGKKAKNDFENNYDEDGMFGGEDLYNDPGY